MSMTTRSPVLDRDIYLALRDDTGYNAIQDIFGVGEVFAAVFVAEIGDVTRFPNPKTRCSWAGLTPKHHESDLTVHRGRITKMGSRLVRWAGVEPSPATTAERPSVTPEPARLGPKTIMPRSSAKTCLGNRARCPLAMRDP
jgi:hypothetical protein